MAYPFIRGQLLLLNRLGQTSVVESLNRKPTPTFPSVQIKWQLPILLRNHQSRKNLLSHCNQWQGTVFLFLLINQVNHFFFFSWSLSLGSNLLAVKLWIGLKEPVHKAGDGSVYSSSNSHVSDTASFLAPVFYWHLSNFSPKQQGRDSGANWELIWFFR